MAMLRNIRMLTRYCAWANQRLFAALSGLAEDEVTAPRSEGAGSMINVLNHAYVVDQIWQAHMLGTPHGFSARNTDTLPSLGELQSGQCLIDAWYIAYADELSEKAYSEVVNFEFVGGGPGAMTRGDMLLHIVNHKTYHRGFVAQMLYQASQRPPVMDLPVFLRDAFEEFKTQ
jgi:uncharacterized damage-inducible protein DinB